MFASLLLVAIFSSAFSFYAEAQAPPKCDETLITKIYDYWNKNGGIPQRVIERNIKFSEREVAVLATPGFPADNFTCFVIRHFADSNLIYFINDNKVITNYSRIYREHFGQVSEPPKASSNNWFMIRGVDGKVTKEGCDAMKKLVVEFGYTETLRTFDEKCPVPNEVPLIGSFCDDNSSCTVHKQ